jgi:hypothetical protein
LTLDTLFTFIFTPKLSKVDELSTLYEIPSLTLLIFALGGAPDLFGEPRAILY